jgi:hypothetical protein
LVDKGISIFPPSLQIGKNKEIDQAMVEETVVGISHIFPHLRGCLLQAFEKIKGKVQGFIEQKMSQQSK